MQRYANASRENIGAAFEAMYHTPLQMLFKLKAFRDMQAESGGPSTVRDLCQAYNEEVTTTAGEAVSVDLHRSQLSQALLNGRRSSSSSSSF
jgi:hypothetical protein